MLLDADIVCLRPPETLLQHPAYHRTGALFFPDFWELDFAHPLWSVVGHGGVGGGSDGNGDGEGGGVGSSVSGGDGGSRQAELQQESGIVLVDRWRHWGALLLLCYMNGDGQAEWYATLCDGGEKETYHSAWRFVLSAECCGMGASCWPVYGVRNSASSPQAQFSGHLLHRHPPQIHQLDLPHGPHLSGLNLGANSAIEPPNLLRQDHDAAWTRRHAVRSARDTRQARPCPFA